MPTERRRRRGRTPRTRRSIRASGSHGAKSFHPDEGDRRILARRSRLTQAQPPRWSVGASTSSSAATSRSTASLFACRCRRGRASSAGSSSTSNRWLPVNVPAAQNGSVSLASNGWRITGTSEPGIVVEHGPMVRPGQAQLGNGVHRHRRPAVRPHRQRRVRRPAGARRTARPLVADDVHLAAPHAGQRPVADVDRRARRAAARASDRGCGARRRRTPNTSASVAWRSTVVVSASTVDRRRSTPGQRDEQRDVPHRLVERDRGLAPDVAARRGSARGRCTRSTAVSSHASWRSSASSSRPSQWSIIESLAP